MKHAVEIRAVMSEGRPSRGQLCSAQTRISHLGFNWFRPVLSWYKRRRFGPDASFSALPEYVLMSLLVTHFFNPVGHGLRTPAVM